MEESRELLTFERRNEQVTIIFKTKKNSVLRQPEGINEETTQNQKSSAFTEKSQERFNDAFE
jgi:hypothetical protein